MSEWMGVTVSGTPQRVTALNLADLGLDGELSGLLGNLTGLTTLDLSGNPLTGMLPSKLALLTNLANVSLTGTSLHRGALQKCWVTWRRTTSARQAWMNAGRPQTPLTDSSCSPTGLGDPSAAPTLPPGTYYSEALRVHGSDLVFDVPEGASVVYMGVGRTNRSVPEPGEDNEYPRSDLSAGFRDTNSWSGFGIDAVYSGYFGIVYDPALDDAERAAFKAIMEYIVESSWLRPAMRQTRGSGIAAVVVAIVFGAAAFALSEYRESRTADADIGSPGAYTISGHIARNVILAQSIRVCTLNVPNTTAIAIDEVNTALKDSGFVNFNVFTLVPTPPGATRSPCRLTGVKDRVDYVQVTMFTLNPCDRTTANGCVVLERRQSGDHLQTHFGDLEVKLNGLRHDNDADDNSDLQLARTIAHELFHLLGMEDEYRFERLSCDRRPSSANVPSLMHCRGDGKLEKPLGQGLRHRAHRTCLPSR